MIGIYIAGTCLLFLIIITIRGILFRPTDKIVNEPEVITIQKNKIVEDFIAMIQCKTVSYRKDDLIAKDEFSRFQKELVDRFPGIHKVCSLEHIGKTGLLYCWKGKSNSKASVCMAHYDVVPADEEYWTKPPFAGILEDDVIWGRGTLDTKATLCGIMEAAEQLIEENYLPKEDIYFAFSGEEEIDGNTCADIVAYLEKKGIIPEFVLDEGGALVSNVFPGVNKECALIGVGEKGSVNIGFTLESQGGHASTPPVHTILGKLAKAVVAIEKKPFPAQFTKPVVEMFNTLGRHSSLAYRILFANLWCFKPLLSFYCKISGGELNAMVRTTCAVTKMEGSRAFNVLPPVASFGVNMRVLGEDTIESGLEYLKKTIKNKNIAIEVVNGMNPSSYSNTKCKAYDTLQEVILESWPDVIVSPYLMMACSDSRHYCRITDKVYRFSAMRLSKEERGMIHGHNERIPVETVCQTVKFYIRLLKRL